MLWGGGEKRSLYRDDFARFRADETNKKNLQDGDKDMRRGHVQPVSF